MPEKIISRYLNEIKKSYKSNKTNSFLSYSIKNQNITLSDKKQNYLSFSNLKEFENHYGRGFHYKIVDLLDEWPKKNSSKKKSKKLEKIISNWNKLKQYEKIQEVKSLEKN